MNNKEFLEKLINDIEEQNEIVSKEPHLIINIKVNAEAFIPLLHNIKQDLEVLEWLKEHIDICISDFNWNSLRDFIKILILEYADGKKVKEWLENE